MLFACINYELLCVVLNLALFGWESFTHIDVYVVNVTKFSNGKSRALW